MPPDPARIGYAYRYAQGKVAHEKQAVPAGLSVSQRDEWVRGWLLADQDQAVGRPSRLPVEAPPVAPVEEAPPVPPAPAPEPEPVAAPPVAPSEPRIVKAKVRAPEPAPEAPKVILANKAPPVVKPAPWLLLRVHRDDTGFRVESEGSDATLPGNGVDALTQAIDVHVRLRLGPDEEDWTK